MTILIEMVTRFVLDILSVVVDNHLFIEELDLEGMVGKEIGLMKAMFIQAMPVHPPTHLHPPPNQLWPIVAKAPVPSYLLSLF